MANTYTCLHYHVIFSTKHRERWITQDIEQRIWEYLGGIARQNDLKPLMIGAVEDHIHMLLTVPPSLSVSDALKRIKGGSSGWVKENFPSLQGFGWQDGYGAFTVSKSQIHEVDEYIRNQREHHRVKTFQEEYRAFLDKHEVEYNEQYLWG
jgi:putative transposase